MKHRIVSTLFLVALSVIISSSNSMADKLSPMAKLMREMLKFVKEEKGRIEAGKEPHPFPKQFEKIKTAKLTNGKKPAKDHEQYLASFLEQLNAYYKAKENTERKQSFNMLINTCITCHEEECPGPIQTIKANKL